MTEIKSSKTSKGPVLIKILGIILLALLMLVSGVCASPYAYITNSKDDTVSVIDTENNTITATIPVGSFPYGVVVSPDGKKAYVTNEFSDTVSVINTTTNNAIATVDAGTGPTGIEITPDGNTIYVVDSGSSTISVINTDTNNITATVNVGNFPYGIAISPDGKTVYVANSGENTISVIDTDTNNITATVDVGDTPYGVAVTPTGQKAYVANENSNTVSVIDTATNNVTTTISAGTQPTVIVITPDGTKAYVTNQLGGNISIIDTATDDVTDIIVGVGTGIGIAITPDGKTVYVTDYAANKVSAIDTETNNVTATVQVGCWPLSLGKFIGPASVKITPVASFTASNTSGIAPLFVIFDGTGSKNAQTYSWVMVNKDTNEVYDLGTAAKFYYVFNQTGRYDVTLTVTSSDGTSAISDPQTITITTLVQVAQETVEDVQKLVTSGAINRGQGNSLIVKLNKTITYLNNEKPNKAINELNLFIHEVKAYTANGVLPSSKGQLLINNANLIIEKLKRTNADEKPSVG